MFLASMIHEIKIPLTIIQNSLYLYFNKSNKDDKNLTSIKNNIEILHRDIINILNAEKINQAQQLYNHTAILNVSDATAKIIEVFKYNINQKKIALTFAFTESLYVRIDSSAFNRIINNLLDNAVKYTPEKGEINVKLLSDSSCIYLTVEDNGKGISQKELKEIFRPYYRMHTKTGEDGLGIGLYLVKSIVDSLSGRIEVKSEEGKGTSFTVILPKYNPTKNDDVTDFTPGDVI